MVAEPVSPRRAIEPVAELFGLSLRMDAGRVVVERRGAWTGAALALDALVQPEDGAAVSTVREPDHALPGEALVAFRDPMRDFEAASARFVRDGATNPGQERLAFAGALDQAAAEALATDWLKRRWREREQASFAVPAGERRVRPGAVVRLPQGGSDFLVTEIDDGLVRRIRAVRTERLAPGPAAATLGEARFTVSRPAAAPAVELIDLPLVSGAEEPWRELRVAAWARPWRTHVVYASPEASGFEQRAVLANAATMGVLVEPLGGGTAGRVDDRTTIRVALSGGSLESLSQLQFLNGGNAAAIRSAGGAWEVVQFRLAEEVEPDVWLLSDLLRGQLGTEDAMQAGAAAGAAFVLLDGAVTSAGLKPSEAGLDLNFRVGPVGADLAASEVFTLKTASGGVRAALPLAPVHLSARRTAGGDLAIAWIRRGRISADDWEADEVPLGEEAEAYAVEVRTAGGTLLRATETGEPAWTYPAAAIAADFGGGSGPAVLQVRQRKRAGGTAGLPASLSVPLG